MYLLCLSSRHTIITDAAPARKSAIGPAYIIPLIPAIIGNIIISGSRNIICLVSDKNIPRFGLPIAVKKLEVIGCIKLMNVKKRNI